MAVPNCTDFCPSSSYLTPIEEEDSLRSFFQKRIGLFDQRIFDALWTQAIDAGRFSWTRGESLSLEKAEKIEAALRATLVFHGPGIEAKGDGTDLEVSEIINFLLGRGQASKEWLNRRNIAAVLLEKDEGLLRAMEQELRARLQSCGQMLPLAGSAEEAPFQAFVGNLVALLPYCYPEEGVSFLIPQKVDGVWRVFSYSVDRKIELTPRWLSSPIIALGMTTKGGPPLISFLGSTYPTGDGCIAAILSDLTPGLSVGHAPYLSGRKNIEEWLEGKESVRLFGMSLGGSIALHVLRNHPTRVEELTAYNPAGLYSWNWNGYENSAAVNIYYQENDLVASVGFFPEGDKVSVFRVFGEKEKDGFQAHIRVYAGEQTVTLLKSDPTYENGRWSRKILTLLHMVFGTVFVLIPLLCFYLLFLLLSWLLRPLLAKNS